MIRKVCVITGSRAEYGHLQWLVNDIAEEPSLVLQMLVTGMHLEEKYGNTYKEIESDGHRIDAKVNIHEIDDSEYGIARSMAMALSEITLSLNSLKPDIIVILGDRFEMMAAAQAAMLNRIPIAHIHGGETTQGAIDEAMRHSITKMSHLHFVAAEVYRKRVIQLGEQPDKVFNFGAPGLCALDRKPLLTKDELSKSLEVELGERFFLVTYHPVTLSDEGGLCGIKNMLAAMETFEDFNIIITAVNSDTGNSVISHAYKEFEKKYSKRVFLVDSLGHHRYLSALKSCSICIGNSSSGIIEAPALQTPTVNIGIRQKGRIMAESIINCDDNKDDIIAAINCALSNDFKNTYKNKVPPYGNGGASTKIKDVLKNCDLSKLLIKKFYDVEGF
jgi:UDP-hydrolysing UDP-N-acetyl-D-glucosamine 2-epimerase